MNKREPVLKLPGLVEVATVADQIKTSAQLTNGVAMRTITGAVLCWLASEDLVFTHIRRGSQKLGEAAPR
jgi:hypothetical protein